MKIIELEIRNVRGIKELILQPHAENFVVWGTNGTGKSAVVDAIDFLLTGKINRLVGAGTGGITLEAHGAHIDCEDPSQAFVRAVVQLNRSDSQVEIHRCMDDPDSLHGPEESQEQLSKIVEIAKRGQHVLTRREILRFVTATGGKRAEDIQELMSLTEIESIRKNFVSVRNQTRRDQGAAVKNQKAQENQVAVRVGLEEYDVAVVLSKINEHRTSLKGEEITELLADLLQSGISPPITKETSPGISIEVFEKQITQLTALSSEGNQIAVQKNDQQLRTLVSGIHQDAQLLRSFSSRELVKTGLKLLDDSGSCPLCDRPWEPGELETYLNIKLEDAANVGERVEVIDGVAQELSTEITRVKIILNNVIGPVEFLKLDERANTLNQWKTDLETLEKALEKPLEKYHQPKFSCEQVQRVLAPDDIEALVEEIKSKAKEEFPKTTPEQTAWDTLTKLTVDVKQLQDVSTKLENAQLTAQRADSLHREFVASRDEILGDLYDGIRNRFVELYRELHEEDEGDFEATLQLSEASLDFEVDFYGRGSHPPHALHSEGHQDSMGVCLFLALSEKLTHGEIGLIVLDDVVMSVDKSHRRKLCGVLANNFPDNQFLITTHDQAWAMQLKSSAVVKSRNMYQFFDWDLDSGPRVSDTKNLWDRIDKDLELNDVPAAAAKLRRGSEQFFAEVCDNLKAQVTFSLESRYELGDLLNSAKSRFSKLERDSRKAYASWHDTKPDEVEIMGENRIAIYEQFGREQWAVNVNVHYNEWVDMDKNDFQPVVDAFRALFGLFTCPDCDGTLYLIQVSKENKNVRCPCSQVTWNLEKKKNE